MNKRNDKKPAFTSSNEIREFLRDNLATRHGRVKRALARESGKISPGVSDELHETFKDGERLLHLQEARESLQTAAAGSNIFANIFLLNQKSLPKYSDPPLPEDVPCISVSPRDLLEAAISKTGSVNALAERLAVARETVSRWRGSAKEIPPGRLPELKNISESKT